MDNFDFSDFIIESEKYANEYLIALSDFSFDKLSVYEKCPSTDYKLVWDTPEKRKLLLLGLVESNSVKNSILENFKYFDEGLSFIFNTSYQKRVILKPYYVAKWEGIKECDDTTRFNLKKLYHQLCYDEILWSCMLMVYRNLDNKN